MSYAKEVENIPVETLKNLYRVMVTIRRFEEKIIEVYPHQEIKTPVHLYIGQEAVAAGVCANLSKDDYIFSTHRSPGHYLAKGGEMKQLVAELYGKKTGCSKGKGGSMHGVDPKVGVWGSTAIVGGNIPLFTGAALASVMQGRDRVSVCFFGDGAVDEGSFHEGLNFASLRKLPAIFVCENNFYATHSHQSKRQPHDFIYKLAEGYLLPGIRVDGNNVLDVYKVAHEAVRKAREGEGPTLIECRTYRWRGHVGPDYDINLGYRTREELNRWMRRCPIGMFESLLVRQGVMTKKEIDEVIKQADKEIHRAYIYAKESPYPEAEELFDDVWSYSHALD